MTFAVGDRVRVDLSPKRDLWNEGAAAVLDGAVGVVDRVGTQGVRVTFDPPLPKTWAHGSPTTGHWFDFFEVHPC